MLTELEREFVHKAALQFANAARDAMDRPVHLMVIHNDQLLYPCGVTSAQNSTTDPLGATCPSCQPDLDHWCEFLIEAGMLLGALKAENKTTLAQIVRAAEEAHDTHPESCRECDCRHYSASSAPIGCECACHGVFDRNAFFRAIALEYLGQEKAADAFGEITIPLTESACAAVLPRMELLADAFGRTTAAIFKFVADAGFVLVDNVHGRLPNDRPFTVPTLSERSTSC